MRSVNRMLNFWAIEKDVSIKLLLIVLGDNLGVENFRVAENRQLDARSVRIYKRDDELVSAYVYTYGQSEGRYGIHLEYPFNDDADILSNDDIREDVDLDNVVQLLRTHLDVVN